MAIFSSKQTVDLSLAEVAAILSQRFYYDRVSQTLNATTSRFDAQPNSNGINVTVVRTASTQQIANMGIPGLPAEVNVDESSHWNFPGTGENTITGTTELGASGLPGKVVVNYRFTAESSTSCAVLVDGEINVNVPFFGKKIEQQALPYVDRVVAEQMQLLADCK